MQDYLAGLDRSIGTRARGTRNLLDNAQMEINQRRSLSAALSGNVFIADRWMAQNAGVGAATLFYNTMASFGVAVPAGRPRPAQLEYIQMTTADAALAATDYMVFRQAIEGFNVQQLQYGTANAAPLTLTFDVFCTISTQFIVELYNGDSTGRTISKFFTTIAGQFTTITLNYPGDTGAGYFFTDGAQASLYVQFFLAAGSNYTTGTLQTSWGSLVQANRMVGLTNAFPATVGNKFAVTNVQLEIGVTATPLEIRPYMAELFTAQRYFERIDAGANANTYFASGQCFATTQAVILLQFSATKRATPTLSYSAASDFAVFSAIAAVVPLTSIATGLATLTGASINTVSGASLAAGNATTLLANATTAARIDVGVEI